MQTRIHKRSHKSTSAKSNKKFINKNARFAALLRAGLWAETELKCEKLIEQSEALEKQLLEDEAAYYQARISLAKAVNHFIEPSYANMLAELRKIPLKYTKNGYVQMMIGLAQIGIGNFDPAIELLTNEKLLIDVQAKSKLVIKHLLESVLQISLDYLNNITVPKEALVEKYEQHLAMNATTYLATNEIGTLMIDLNQNASNLFDNIRDAELESIAAKKPSI